MKGIDNIVAVLALVIAFYTIVSLRKSGKDKDNEHVETLRVIREAIVVIKDQMIDVKGSLKSLESATSMTSRLTEGNTMDVRSLMNACGEMRNDIAVLKDRSNA